jgi:signal peptidase I
MDNELEVFQTPNERRKKVIISAVSVVVVVLVALAVALLLKTYVISTIPVGGNSMLPTLEGGEYVTDGNGNVVETIKKGDTLVLNKLAKIKRGDVIVFDVNWQSDPIVKRVIAIAGDHVEINNDGFVYVNGERLNEGYIQGKTYSSDGVTPLDVVVPEGHVFCLGDNREHSHDSRYGDIGAVSLEAVRGKCILVVGKDGKLRTL